MSTPESQVNRPDYKCKAYTSQLEDMQLVRDVLGGTKTLRAAGPTYLPPQPKEKLSTEYPDRVKRSFSFNFTKKTRGGLVGMVCKEDPKLKESVPLLLRQHWENIDLAGTHGAVFAKEVFEDAISDGHSFILVDMQPGLPAGSTRADEKAAGRRPYWVRRTKKQAINFRPAVINGEETIGQITFEECTTEPDGEYGEKEVTRYRTFKIPVVNDGKDPDTGVQLRPATYGTVQWEVKRKVKDQSGQETFVIDGAGITSLTRIPVAVVYGGNQTGFLESEPLLLDLAYLNIDWWQQYSDYRTQLNRLVPVLLRIGMTPEQIKAYGEVAAIVPSEIVDVPKDGDLRYVSHNGQALSSARQAILDTEQRAAMSGLSILTQRADSNITATEKRMDQGERTSDLANAARSLRDGIELAFGFHAQFEGIADKMGDGGSVELGVKEETLVIDPTMLGELNTMIDKGRFFVEDLLDYMQGGFKAIDFDDLKKRIEQLEAEKEAEAKAREAAIAKGEMEADPMEDEDEMAGAMNRNTGPMKPQGDMNG